MTSASPRESRRVRLLLGFAKPCRTINSKDNASTTGSTCPRTTWTEPSSTASTSGTTNFWICPQTARISSIAFLLPSRSTSQPSSRTVIPSLAARIAMVVRRTCPRQRTPRLSDLAGTIKARTASGLEAQEARSLGRVSDTALDVRNRRERRRGHDLAGIRIGRFRCDRLRSLASPETQRPDTATAARARSRDGARLLSLIERTVLLSGACRRVPEDQGHTRALADGSHRWTRSEEYCIIPSKRPTEESRHSMAWAQPEYRTEEIDAAGVVALRG